MLRYTINHLMSISNLWHVALEFRLKNENMELNTLIGYSLYKIQLIWQTQ